MQQLAIPRIRGWKGVLWGSMVAHQWGYVQDVRSNADRGTPDCLMMLCKVPRRNSSCNVLVQSWSSRLRAAASRRGCHAGGLVETRVWPGYCTAHVDSAEPSASSSTDPVDTMLLYWTAIALSHIARLVASKLRISKTG
jgi:hypothetical protein